MGIQGLTQLIKQKSPNSIKNINLHNLRDKRIAIDTSIFLYKSLINIRHKDDYLRNKNGKIISHIQGLYMKTIQYLSLGIMPIYIFDGKPPIEKRECIQERNKKAEENKQKMKLTNNLKEKQSFEKNSIRIKQIYIDDLKHLFSLMGVSYIHPNGEAEAYASELCRIGYVDAVVTEDMDTLVYGCPLMIRKCIDKSIKRPDIITTFNLEQILSDFKMTLKEFTDICILCGCDYCPKIPKIGSIRAFQKIQNYKTIENYIESDKSIDISDNFKNKYPLARKLFTVYKNKIDIMNIPIHKSKYNAELLYNYLVYDCSMSEKRVQNSLKRIKQLNNK